MRARKKLRADFARYYHAGQKNPKTFFQRLKIFRRNEAMWAIAVYRLGQYLDYEASRSSRFLLRLPYVIFWRFVQYTIGIHLFPAADIGPGLYIGHYGEIWISPKTKMGANCNVSQGVVIGTAGQRAGSVIGDRVWIGPHAVITGPARIGAGAVIGANSCVVSNIPENSVAIGVPARVISNTGSSKLIKFPKQLAYVEDAFQDTTA